MKKIWIFIVCLLGISLSVRADDDRPISFGQLPAKAQEYVREFFPLEKIVLVKMEKDFFGKSYTVFLGNSGKVEFSKDGTCKKVDCKYATVPEAVIPSAIIRYIKSSYPGYKVIRLEMDDGEYETKLSNGIKLKFDKKFNLTDIDN